MFNRCKLPKSDLTDRLHPNVNFSKCFYFQPSFNEAFLICSDLTEAVGPYSNANLLKYFQYYPIQYLNEFF